MSSVTPLGELIAQCVADFRAEHGVELSYGDIARRSGERLQRTRVQQLATGPIKALPEPKTITGLALGLGVTERVVLRAALVSAGYRVPPDWRGGGGPARPPGRSNEQDYADMAAVEAVEVRRLPRRTSGRGEVGS